MSTVANQRSVQVGSRLAPAFVGLMSIGAALFLLQSAAATPEWHRLEFVGLLLAGAVSSRFKIKLPGLNGNMSVNLPFIFIAITQLSMAEALAVAGLSVFIQSIPKAPHKFVMVQAAFNLSTALVAAGLAWHVFRSAAALHQNAAFSLVLSCATHLLASTLPVAIIISLTDRRDAFVTWYEIFHLSFPYYLASTGLASIAAGVGTHASLPMLLGFVLVMFVTYRSYRLYFEALRMQRAHRSAKPAATQAKGAAAGQ